MLDDFTNFTERFFAAHRVAALEFANWIIAQIEKPAKMFTRPKSEHPSTYETVDPEIAHLHWLETHQSPQD